VFAECEGYLLATESYWRENYDGGSGVGFQMQVEQSDDTVVEMAVALGGDVVAGDPLQSAVAAGALWDCSRADGKRRRDRTTVVALAQTAS